MLRSSFFHWLAVFAVATPKLLVHGYPMLLELEEDEDKDIVRIEFPQSVAVDQCTYLTWSYPTLYLQCIIYSIPEKDDAHLLFIAVPSAVEAESYVEDFPQWPEHQKQMEDWYLSQAQEFSKLRNEDGEFPVKLPNDPPKEIADIQAEFLKAEQDPVGKAGVAIKIVNPASGHSRSMEAFWFTPIVVNNMHETVAAGTIHPHEGYVICFSMDHSDRSTPAQMIMDVILASEPLGADKEEDTKLESAHLLPLSQQLSESIAAAQKVIREMNYMEKREQRMRLTADSINGRVRRFSYVSVTVLLVVTYLQVTYLKRYFHKKKLL